MHCVWLGVTPAELPDVKVLTPKDELPAWVGHHDSPIWTKKSSLHFEETDAISARHPTA